MGELLPHHGHPGKRPLEQRSTSGGKDQLMGVTLRGWAISAISAIAVATAAGTTVIKLYQQFEEHKVNDATTVASLTRANETLGNVASGTGQVATEAQKHLNNNDRFITIPLSHDAGETVTAEYYPSDKCVHLWRDKGAGQAYGTKDQDLWMIAPKTTAQSELMLPETSPSSAETPVSRHSTFEKWSSAAEGKSGAVLKRISDSRPASLKRVGMYQGSCINPHPGTFQIRNVQLNACTIQVWREFKDGCKHNQIYNACSGQWDPKINWTFCAAQHHP